MQSIAATLILCIPGTLLLAALFWPKHSSLNARVLGRTAEFLLWGSFMIAFFGLTTHLLNTTKSGVFESTWFGTIGVRLDGLSMIMLAMVTFLGGVLLRYSRNYLSGDKQQGYFFKWMLVTLASVITLCLASTLLQIGLSWIASSLGLHKLLVYFSDRRGALLAARKKFVISRLGDLCIGAAFIGIYTISGTHNLSEIFASISAGSSELNAHHWIGWLIVFGAILKSAQFPFHTWLPETMATPTPVSALMHAGIVNAGGFLVIRVSPVLMETPSALGFLAVVGAITAVYGAIVMQTQTSIKQALAYSTIAQMGFMMLQCGVGAFSLAVLHIVAHSLYKAHAFLSSGSSVEQLKVLPQAPSKNLTFLHLVNAVLIGGGVVIALSWAWGISLTNKPGMLVLGAVLSFASAQLLLSRWAQDTSVRAMAKSTVAAIAFVALYFGLSIAADQILRDSGIAVAATVSPTLQIVLSLLLSFFFFLSLILLNTSIQESARSWQKALYVHALNGFYLNTIAARVSRSNGIIPADK